MRFRFLLLLFLITACTSAKPTVIKELPESASVDQDQFYFKSVKPLLDKRCVSCHSCYTAPCQLNLAHIEGMRRGATKNPLYDGTRITAAEPSRLFVDAHSALEWMQKKDFFPVARMKPGQPSLTEALLWQRVMYPGPVGVVSNESHECPADNAQFEEYQKKLPNSGMPYGFPPLAPHEIKIINRWLESGYPKLTASRQLQLSQPQNILALRRWEQLWNQGDPKHRLVARYIYEHLFLGHLRIPELPGEFYRMVRSRTKAPEPIDVIATTWPFDDPGVSTFYYRLQKVEETLTLKNHLIYPLSQETWQRWQEIFFEEPWALEAQDFPSYENKVAANPFLAFKAIPAESRYRFLLDNSLFFVSAFIKGPVCEGPIAVNVIDEHFHILFLAPREDLAQQSPGFLERAAQDLSLPAEGRNNPLSSLYVKYKAAQLDFVEQRQKLFAESFPKGLELNDIWDGDSHNPQALLTVFRHFDNASVSTGAIGRIPKTIWVMDYPIFERMYYLLVAGFDVFGNVFHQSATRMYMDNLRVESEDLFLSFFPSKTRQNLRRHWYRGLAAQELMKYLNPYGGVPASSLIPYYTQDPKREFLQYVLKERFNARVRGQTPVVPPRDKVLDQLNNHTGAQYEMLPDLTFLLVEGKDDRLYSLIHHKEHLNVSFMFGEDGRRVPAEDRLEVLPGVYGAFPNFFVKVREDQLQNFVRDTLRLNKNPRQLKEWIALYGISRQNPDFWRYFDRVQQLTDQSKHFDTGILDLSKYELW
ncbi:MAG TPA: fatty acid cis/trans isomerase [Oligoflexus sp.]|uniref:fatty acid cis/trans isomerase n=1 Tax=Oligoflexus sp. TaxID=1971216 RepID=UPI002D80D68B|nr:fatty acid cis/trans isomerase [Oligoflexus sp.]HET9235764.1 fatty acid cis/trans isomerase [Oligoflexus sp.]